MGTSSGEINLLREVLGVTLRGTSISKRSTVWFDKRWGVSLSGS